MSLLKKFLIGLVLIAVVAFGVKKVFFEKQPHITIKQQANQFYYYPKLNTYYDVTANSFYYTLDGGTTWVIKKPATPDAPNTLGEKVVLYSESGEIWKDNALHIQQYNGVAVNYAKEDSISKMVSLNDSLEKAKTAALHKEEEEPTVKGKFLKKLRQKIKKRRHERQREDSAY